MSRLAREGAGSANRCRPRRPVAASTTCWASLIRTWTLPRIDPDARRRRLGALINTANLARTEPILYVMEDVHWIDEASESMMADGARGHRPDACNCGDHLSSRVRRSAHARWSGAQTVSRLTPLTDSESSSLVGGNCSGA